MNLLGHNRPDYIAAVREQMSEALAQFTARRDEFIAKAPSYVVRDREDAKRVVDFIGMARDIEAMIHAARKTVSDPHHDARSLAINIANDFWAPVIEALEIPQGKLDAYTAKRKALMDEQQAEQDSFRQPAHDASAPRAAVDYTAPSSPTETPAGMPEGARPARKQQIVGDYGYRLSEVTRDAIEVVDVLQVPESILNSDPVKEAIAKVALAIVKATKQKTMPGCRITQKGSTSIRS
jgi:hypothetical protein